MQVVVIGAGLAGVTAAWELCQSGHQVTVLDRHPQPAAETSHANAGLIATGHAMPWASPKVPGILFKSLFQSNQAYRLKPRLDPHMLAWGLRFLRHCTQRRNAENTVHAWRLCHYSQQCLRQVAEQAGVDYHAQREGLFYLYHSAESLRQGVEEMRIVRDLGHQVEVLGVDEIVALDPAYEQAAGRIAGAAWCPTDESGDARLFTLGLAEACRARGVEFVHDCEVQRIVADGDRIRGVHTAAGPRDAELLVLAAGVEAPRLARPIGLNLPIYPVKGYSLTFPIGPTHNAPQRGGLDGDQLMAFSRLGDQLRVTSTAEIAGYDSSFRPADFSPIIDAFSRLMPDAADYQAPEYWACLRPMTPNGLPIIGASRYRNLYLNVGHGNMGWTMACGSARLLVDVINGRESEIPTAALSPR